MFGELQPVGGGDSIPLLKRTLVVGRRESADVVLRFSTISGSHCELVVEEGLWVVRDLNSSNGTKVNGVRVSEQHIKPGDTLSFAKYAFEVFYDPAELGATDDAKNKLAETDVFSRSLLEASGLEPRRKR
ncbi:FHA domain-containing protein [Pirellulales bacterium]|jgi:adenylate cyclase|nr:FHA domain-containing protein [Pirellulales bacterium]MDA7938605.1 FHA domain-containing protein [Pirellulales bacterium]